MNKATQTLGDLLFHLQQGEVDRDNSLDTLRALTDWLENGGTLPDTGKAMRQHLKTGEYNLADKLELVVAALPSASSTHDNYGQVVLYTGVYEYEDGELADRPEGSAVESMSRPGCDANNDS